MKNTFKKSPTHSLAIALFLLPTLLFAQSPPIKATFYGHENPKVNQGAPSLSIQLPKRQRLTSELFDFEKYRLVEKADLPAKGYYYILTYKNDSLRHFQIFEGEGVLFIKEEGRLYMVPKGESSGLLLLQYQFKGNFWDEHDIVLSDKSARYVPLDEEELLEDFPQALAVLSFPEELKDPDFKAQKVFAEGLIRRHLLLYERYYNFPKVRVLILDNFQGLAQDLADVGLPVRIVHGGIGCVHFVPYELWYRDGEWQCWFGGIDEWLVMAAIERFNLVVEGEE